MLKWNIPCFDTKMETWVANWRRKKRRDGKKKAGIESEVQQEPTPKKSKQDKDTGESDSEGTVKSYHKGAAITLISGDDVSIRMCVCVYVCMCVFVFVCSCVCTCVYVRVQQSMAHGTIVDDEPCIEELLESLNDGIHVLHTVFSFIVLLISVYTLYILISCRITTMSRNVQGGFDQNCCPVSPSSYIAIYVVLLL